MFHLPNEILLKIFEYDPTYHGLHTVLAEELKILIVKKAVSIERDRIKQLQRLRVSAQLMPAIEQLISYSRAQIKEWRPRIIDYMRLVKDNEIAIHPRTIHRFHTKLLNTTLFDTLFYNKIYCDEDEDYYEETDDDEDY